MTPQRRFYGPKAAFASELPKTAPALPDQAPLRGNTRQKHQLIINRAGRKGVCFQATYSLSLRRFNPARHPEGPGYRTFFNGSGQAAAFIPAYPGSTAAQFPVSIPFHPQTRTIPDQSQAHQIALLPGLPAADASSPGLRISFSAHGASLRAGPCWGRGVKARASPHYKT